MPVYRHNGDVYDIPQDKAREFESQFPDATVEVYSGNDVYDIPVVVQDEFFSRYSDASYSAPSAPSAEEVAEEMQPKDETRFGILGKMGQYMGSPSAYVPMPQNNEREELTQAEIDQRAAMRQMLQESGTIDRMEEMEKEARKNKFKAFGEALAYTPQVSSFGVASNIYDSTEEQLADAQRAMEASAEHRQNKAMEQTIDVALDKARAGEWGGIGENNVGNGVFDFGLGLWDSATRMSTWDFGVSDTLNGLTIAQVVKKWEEDPESLTATERNLLDAMGMATAVQEAYQDQVGIGYAVGESLPQSAGFMASMYLNPASGLGKSLARQAVKKYGRQSIAKNLARIGGDIAETAIMTATTGGGRVVADALDRINGQSTYDIDPETGIVMYGGQEDQKTVGEAVVKAIGSNFIENYSEALGEYFDPLLGMSRRVAAGGLRKMNLDKWADALSDVEPSQMAASIRSLREKAKFGGVFGEIMEEEVGMALNAITVGDYTFSKEEAEASKGKKQWVFDLENQLTTALSCAIMSGALTGYETISNVGYRREMEKSVTEAEKAARAAVGDEMIAQIDQASPEGMVDILRDAYMDQNLSLQQKRALAEYATQRVRMQYYNAADAKARRQVNVAQQNALDAYEAGRHAQLPQYYNIDQEYRRSEAAINERENAEEIWDAIRLMNNMDENERQNIMRDFSEEDQELIRNWRYNAYRWQGAINHRAEQVEDLVDEYAGQVNPYTRPDGTLTTAILGDNVVYVMSEAENGDAVVYTNDGRKIFCKMRDLEHVQQHNAEELIERFRQQTTDVVNQETEKNLNYPSEVFEPAVNVEVQTADGKTWLVTAVNGDDVQVSEMVLDRKSNTWNPNGAPKNMTRTEFMDWQKAELDRKKANTYEQGDELTFYVNGEPISAEITGIDPEGNYMVQISHLADGLDKAVSDVYTAEELRKLTTPSSKVSVETTKNESTPTEEIKQSVSEEVTNSQIEDNVTEPTAEVAESVNTDLSRVPKDAKGNPLYEQTDADTAWDDIVSKSNGNIEKAQRAANTMLANKKAALAKEKKSKPKGGNTIDEILANEDAHAARIAQAEQEVAAWEKIASVNARRVQAEELKRAEAEKAANEARKAEEARILAEQEEQARIEREALNGVPDMVDDVPADARARGYRRVNGHKVDRQGVLPSLQGKEVGVKFANDMIANGHVAVIEAETLQPSHLQGQRNPAHFIDEAQPKERNDEASISSARKIASNIRPEEITSSVTAYTGAPTVNMRGEAIQGNSRSDALRVMWAEHPDQAEMYKQYLIDHAEEFGLNAEEIAAMQHPVLVNMLDVSDTDAINLGQYVAQDTESGGTERIKAKNVARKMGGDIRSYANILLRSSEEDASFSELVDKNGVEVLKWMNTKGYITPTQYASAFDSKGNLTAEAKNDLRGILYQSIFQGGNTQLEEQFNSLPAKAQKAILATAYRDYDSPNSERMVAEIQSSIRAYYALSHDRAFVDAKNYKEAKEAMLVWSRQYQMDDVTGESFLPSENFSNFALELAVVYKGWTQTNIQGHFNNVYDLVQGTKEASLFEEADNTPRALAEAIKETFNIEYNGQLNSNSLAVDSQDGQAGERGSDGDTASGERAESGEGSADSGRGTDAAREQGEVDGKRKVTANVFEMAEEAQKKRKSKKDKDDTARRSIQESSTEADRVSGEIFGGESLGEGESVSSRGDGGILEEGAGKKKRTAKARRQSDNRQEARDGKAERLSRGISPVQQQAIDEYTRTNPWDANFADDERGVLNMYRMATINELDELAHKLADKINSGKATPRDRMRYDVLAAYAKSGELKAVADAMGVEYDSPVSLDTIKDLFEKFNSDPELTVLFNRVFPLVKEINPTIVYRRFTKKDLDEGEDVSPDDILGQYSLQDNLIEYNRNQIDSNHCTEQEKASTIVHEMIHAVARYAIRVQEAHNNGVELDIQLPKRLLDAAQSLIEVYDAIKDNEIFNDDRYESGKMYGVSSVHEMLSELADPEFREKLKQVSIENLPSDKRGRVRDALRAIKDFLHRMFGWDSSSAYARTKRALDKLIDNYDSAGYNKARELADDDFAQQIRPSSEENLRFRESDNQDAAYMDAVELGDMYTAQMMVDEAARKAMKKTKVVDKDKQPMLMSHHTDAEGFYVFDRGKIGTGQGQAFLGAGFNFSRGSGSSVYGSRNIQAYLDARKPLRSDRNTLSIYQIEQIIKELNAISGDNIEYNFADNISRAARAIYEYGGDLDTYASLCTAYSGETRDVLEVFEKLGFDSTIEYGDDKRIMNAVVFNSHQIKSADPVTYDDNGNVIPLSERFNLKEEDIRFRDGAPFFSNAERAVENIKQNKATPEQWLAMIKKDGGLKAGEDKWMGLSDWLNEQKEKGVKTLTKDEVLQFIRENQIEIEEVEYGDNPIGFDELKEEYEAILREDGYDAAHEAMVDRFGDDFDIAFDDLGGELVVANEEAAAALLGSENIINSTRLDYTTEGLENKKEIALVVPTIEPWNQSDTIHFGDAGDGRAVAWVRFGETTDADGNHVLVIDEVQSKRHDEGRSKGYRSKEKGDLLAERDRLYDKMYRVGLTEEEYNRRDEVNARLEEFDEGQIPDAPFDKNYHELVMKRMLRYAAENGFDKVAWTKGKQQAQRYGLSTKVSEIAVKANNKGTYNVVIEDINGSELMDYRGSGKEMTSEELSALVGKELSSKLIEGARRSQGLEWSGKGYNPEFYTIRGVDLSIGGEGMKGYYDEMIPRFMNKYTKKWGTKVGEVTLPEVEEAGRTMWSVDVTPEMRESVMQGQPMFREGMGAISDREVSYENDPIAKWQGKPRYYGKRASAFAERERARMQKGVEEAAKILGIEVEIITDASTLKGRKAKAKGWYDINAKKVVVVVPNHVSKGDAVRTVLHEGVAHHGLRELFGAGFDAMLDNIYNNVAPELKARIDAIAERTGVSTSVATEEYLASLAEETNFEEAKQTGWWVKIKGYFMKMLRKLSMPGITLREEITDNELRYLLWRSYQNLVDPNSFLKPLGYIDDVAKQKELKVGEKKAEIIAEVEREAAALGVPVRIVRSVDELPDEETRKRAVDGQLKGYFDPRTGEVVVYEPNTDNANDAKRTVLHEIVGHKGLRQLIGEERYDKAMVQLMYMLPSEVRDAVLRRAERNGWNAAIAMDEYLAEQAERDVQPTWWGKVNAKIRALLRNIGFNVMLTDEDVTYLLWRSRKKLMGDTAFDMATDAILKQAARKSAEADAWNEKAFKDAEMRDFEKGAMQRLRNRIGDAQNEYDSAIKSMAFKQRESWQDSMRSLKVFMDIVSKESDKKIADWENAYMYENAMSSANLMEMQMFRHDVYGRLLKAIHELMESGAKYEEVVDYMMAKHGLERNEKMARAEAEEKVERWKEKAVEEIQTKAAEMLEKQNQRNAVIESRAKSAYKVKKQRLEGQLKRGTISEAQYDHYMQMAEQAYQNELATMKTTHPVDVIAEIEKINTKAEQKLNEYWADHRDYSGLTALTGKDGVAGAESAAMQMIADFEAKHNTDLLWNETRACTQTILNISHDAGILSDKVYDELWNQYEYYIPLRGFDETTAEEVYTYVGDNKSPYNAPIKTAKGRKSKADDPIATIATMADSAIVEANRNRLKQRFLYMVERHRTELASVSSVWVEKDPVTGDCVARFANIPNDATPEEAAQEQKAFEERMEQLHEQDPERYYKASEKPNIPYRVEKKPNEHEHQIIVKRNGKDVVITINGNPRVAQAINGLTNAEAVEGFSKFAGKVNRFLSANFTTRNPAFVVSNFVRDGFYTNSMVWAKEGRAYAWKYNQNFTKATMLLPSLVSKYKRYEKGDKSALDMSDPVERAFYEFMINGGETGYTVINSVEEYKGIVAGDLKTMQGGVVGNTKKAVQAVGEVLDTFGRWAEDTSRFAAFLTSREMGRSVTKSIWDAKEISVNFNKKGSGRKMTQHDKGLNSILGWMSQQGRNLYVFWNAGMQGLYNFGKAVKEHPGKMAGLAGVYFGLGMAMAAIFGGHDDDDEDYWNLPEYVRRNNICFRAGNKFVALPLPIELRAIYGMGELAMSWMAGKEEPKKVGMKVVQQMSQVMPIDMMAEGGGLMAFVPSWVKPIFEVGVNTDWTGMPIYREKTPWNEYDPQWMLAFKSTSPELVAASRAINEATNKNLPSGKENKYDSGWADIEYLNNPAAWEHIAEGYLGGLATMFNQTKKSAMAIWNEDLREVRNIPVVSRFVKDAGEKSEEYALREDYFNAKGVVDELRSQRGHFRKESIDPSLTEEQRKDVMESRVEMEKMVNATISQWNNLENARKKLEDMVKDNPDQEVTFDGKKGNAKDALDEVTRRMVQLTEGYQ